MKSMSTAGSYDSESRGNLRLDTKMKRHDKIHDLQVMFGDPENVKIFNSKRKYISQTKVRLVTSDLFAAGM